MPPKSKKVEDKNQNDKKNAKKLKDELDEIDRELEKINAEEEKKEEKKAEKTAMKTGEFEINNQTIEIFNNLMNYYNSTNTIKCSIEEEKKSNIR
jgi:vacuolar-type H+-ATPase subunit I/STV1